VYDIQHQNKYNNDKATLFSSLRCKKFPYFNCSYNGHAEMEEKLDTRCITIM